MTQQNTMKTGHTVVGVFEEVSQAEKAIQDLKLTGFTPDSISAVTKDRTDQSSLTEATGNEAGQGTLVGSLGGGTLGAVLGWLLAGGTALIPGIGPVVAAGVFAATVSGALIGGTLGGITGALAGSGVPEDEAREYEEHVRGGRTLVTVNTTNSTLLESAVDVFDRNGATGTRYYDVEQGGPGRTFERGSYATPTGGDYTAAPTSGAGIPAKSPTVTQNGQDPASFNQTFNAQGHSDIASPSEFAQVETEQMADRVRQTATELREQTRPAQGNYGEQVTRETTTVEDITTLPDETPRRTM